MPVHRTPAVMCVLRSTSAENETATPPGSESEVGIRPRHVVSRVEWQLGKHFICCR